MNKLWTRDFTIITLGSVVSMFGNAVSGFAMGLMVLDYTNSTFLYALFMICYSIPRVVMPLIAGPYMDRFSRKKVIYGLDFFSAGFYALVGVLLMNDFFTYPLLIVMSMIIGSVDSIYSVAYDSLYPTLIGEGNFTKAYSVSSLIYPLANTIMVPIAGICYNTIGLAPLFIFNAVTFLIAAIFETQISADEKHLIGQGSAKYDSGKFKRDFKEGLEYLKEEKGLMTIAVYFFTTMLAGGAVGALTLPFFRSFDFSAYAIPEWLMSFVKNGEGLGIGIYTIVTSVATVGRFIGGMIHYKFKYPTNKKFAIALFVYTAICFLDGTYLFMPILLMMLFQFLVGILGVTSFNIRISATQNYVPNEKRGRFNGIFQMINMAGGIIGQLMAGVLAEAFPERTLILAFMIFNVVCVFAIMYRNRSHVKVIYNRDV